MCRKTTRSSQHQRNPAAIPQKRQNKNHSSKKVWTLEQDGETSSDNEGFEINAIASNDRNIDKWDVIVEVNDAKIQARCDTGAKCSVLPLACFEHCSKPIRIKPSSVRLVGYFGTHKPTEGYAELSISHNNRNASEKFYIVDAKPDSLGRHGRKTRPHQENLRHTY